MSRSTLLLIPAVLVFAHLAKRSAIAEERGTPSCPATDSLKTQENGEDVDRYVQKLVGTVRQSWNSQSEQERGVLPNRPRSTLVEITILSDGEVKKEEIAQSSGDKFMDQASIDAISRAAPFASLPAQLKTGCIGIGFRFWFTPGQDISVSAGGGVYKVGGGISAPRAIFAQDPAYSKEAQSAKYQGVCVLALIVGPDGNPRDIRVTRRLGKGLDEKAIEAVKQWKFEPAMKDGKPVAVLINVELTFRLR